MSQRELVAATQAFHAALRSAAKKNTVPLSSGYGRASVTTNKDGEVVLGVADVNVPLPPASARKLAKFLETRANEAEKMAKTAVDKTALDSDQERLFDALMMIAENDGDAYRKRDSALAVKNAWRDWRKEHDQNLREDFRVVAKMIQKELERSWKRAKSESERDW